METESKQTKPRILTGIVVSDRAAKTLMVRVDNLIKHRRYGKYLFRSKKYLAHDESGGKFKVGDQVRIRESRPHSKRKSFEVIL